ncbi:flagellar protein FlgN [Bacillus weihaiensis]|uniref:flagellar protein FlgN n=1 Tax=Bacillus weihaiensis TaxID=1547283 RepID=UPI0023560B74|nr:flagellar protein FlgN [Bacillus weihaiensis]
MVAGNLIHTLEKLLQLHQNLYQVALQKTDYLKENNVDKLKELLKKEQMFVQAIKQVEAERIQYTVEFLGTEDEVTLSACIDKAEGDNKQKLEEIAREFASIMDKLKAINQLNRDLTNQALQFVSLSLDMLMPQQSISNYQRPDGKVSQAGDVKNRQSIFDSQA